MATGPTLGWSWRLCELRILGFCLDDVTMAPACRPDALVFSPLMLLPDHPREVGVRLDRLDGEVPRDAVEELLDI